MTLDQAMHTECDRCGEMAMNHRLTDSGNFYCLEFNTEYRRSTMRTIYPIITERKQVAMRAKCNELIKSRSLTSMTGVAKTIKEQWLTLPSPSLIGDQLSL